MAIWNFPLVAGSDALAVSLLLILLMVAWTDGIAHGAHLRSQNPQVFAGLSQDLESSRNNRIGPRYRVGPRRRTRMC